MIIKNVDKSLPYDRGITAAAEDYVHCLGFACFVPP